jgi:hypothetical protein
MDITVVSLAATVLAVVLFGCAVQLDSAPARWTTTTAESVNGQARKAPKTYGVYFSHVPVPPNAGIGLVRVVLTCGHVAAIAKIPDDWYVQTLRPALQSGPEWSEFQLASSAVEFSAGHGVSRLPTLRVLDGAIRIAVDDATCFDMAADVEDGLGSGWKTRLLRSQLRLQD